MLKKGKGQGGNCQMTMQFIEPSETFGNQMMVICLGDVACTGLGGHIEKIDMLEPFFTPLYFNYMEYARELHKEAQKEGFGKIVKGQVLQV